MPSPLNISNIPAPRVDFIDPRTGLMSREWYRFFFNLFNLTGGGTNDTSLTDLQVGPPPINEVLGELGITYDQAQLASMMAQFEEATRSVQNQIDTAPASPQLGTLASVNEDNVRLIGFSTNPSPAVASPAPVGTLYWSNDDATLEFSLEGGTTGQICQQLDFHPKNTGATQINKGMAVMATGVVGASTKITCARAVANGSVFAQYMLGIAAQNIPVNSFGYVVWFGSVRGFNTTGAIKTVPEVWADGDVLYFDPVYPGELTKVEPSAPNLDLPIAIVTNAAVNGAIFVRMKTGESMNELHDVDTSTATNGDLLQYYGAGSYWRNVAPSTVTVGTATNLASGASVEFGLGAVATPSITFTGDLNTGVWSPAADTIAISTAGVERLRVSSTGNVGIGTSSPTASINVGDSTLSTGVAVPQVLISSDVAAGHSITVRKCSNTGTPNISQLKARGTAAAPTIVSSGDGVGSNTWWAYDGTQYRNLAAIAVNVDGTPGVADMPGRFVFSTSPDGAAAPVERMRIDNAGNVGIGTSTPAGRFDVSGGPIWNTNISTPGIALRVTDSSSNGANILSDSSGNITFTTRVSAANTERMRITGAGTVGIGTSTNLSTLTVNGSFASKSPSTVNAATYTVAATDGSLRFTTTNCTVTLPAAVSFPGRILYLNTITANSVTSAASDVIPLGSNTAGTVILVATAGKFAMLQSDGTNWITMLAN